jgi:prepilin-type N-terminal cleavage/methylation domain-containing protein
MRADSMRSLAASPRFRLAAGFTLVEMIVVVLLLSIAMLGILAVFDASARINKSEQDVADAQGAVRYGIYQMTRAIRMAGAGGLFVTQAVLNHRDPQLTGITLVNAPDANSFDNVGAGTTVTNIQGTAVPVRAGTDMIEVRGVLLSPLVAFDSDAANGCQSALNICVGSVPLDVKPATNLGHVNDDAAQRPQFAAIDAYTAGASAANPMMVIVASNIDIHSGCSGIPAGTATPAQYPQSLYNVGVIQTPTTLATTGTFGSVDFAFSAGGFQVIEFDNENPLDAATILGYNFPSAIRNPLRGAGILDDFLFFVDNTDPQHPSLAQGIRRGAAFDVVRIADDVEDMQVAYGVDLDNDGAINRYSAAAPPTDPDPNVSTAVDDDEWVPNVNGETALTPDQFQQDGLAAGASPPFPHGGPQPAAHCPRLHGVMISLVAKGRDPDPTYRADGSRGFRVMNSPVTLNAPYPDTAQYPTTPVAEPHYRRRIQTLKINLRNYANES